MLAGYSTSKLVMDDSELPSNDVPFPNAFRVSGKDPAAENNLVEEHQNLASI